MPVCAFAKERKPYRAEVILDDWVGRATVRTASPANHIGEGERANGRESATYAMMEERRCESRTLVQRA